MQVRPDLAELEGDHGLSGVLAAPYGDDEMGNHGETTGKTMGGKTYWLNEVSDVNDIGSLPIMLWLWFVILFLAHCGILVDFLAMFPTDPTKMSMIHHGNPPQATSSSRSVGLDASRCGIFPRLVGNNPENTSSLEAWVALC